MGYSPPLCGAGRRKQLHCLSLTLSPVLNAIPNPSAGMLRHQTALLECAHRPPANQQHYLNQFLETVKAQGVTGVSAERQLLAAAASSHHSWLRTELGKMLQQ